MTAESKDTGLGAWRARVGSPTDEVSRSPMLFREEWRDAVGLGNAAVLGPGDGSLKLVLTSGTATDRGTVSFSAEETASARLPTSTRSAPTVIVLPMRSTRQAHVQTKQQWEGTVLSVTPNGFIAKLADLTVADHEAERAEFDLDEVTDDDRALVLPGAVFYWHVGYRVEPHGEKLLFSELRFRRLPTWRAADLREIDRVAEELTVFVGDGRDKQVSGG